MTKGSNSQEASDLADAEASLAEAEAIGFENLTTLKELRARLGDDDMNELALIVVNDGNGDQCGYSYQHRLEIARRPSRTAREAHYHSMAWNARQWLIVRFDPDTPRGDIDTAVAELEAYYQQHLAEMDQDVTEAEAAIAEAEA